MKQVVRVAVSNNFNCTDKEWNQLHTFTKTNPDKCFFINSNIHTPKLHTVNDHDYKVVVTANPNLIPQTKILSKLQAIKSKVAFVRVKYLPHNKAIKRLLFDIVQRGYPVVITLQRFNGKASLEKYTKTDYYEYSCSRYRLAGEELTRIKDFVSFLRSAMNKQVWICDESGKGCKGCGLCATLTTNQSLPIASLNLSTSGICKFNCPDCYAKTMQHFCKAMGNNPISFDKIKQNEKQAGRTEHIRFAQGFPVRS
jgi:hypothetical protein